MALWQDYVSVVSALYPLSIIHYPLLIIHSSTRACSLLSNSASIMLRPNNWLPKSTTSCRSSCLEIRSLLVIFVGAGIIQRLPESSALLQSLLSNRAHQVFVFAAREHGFDKGAAQLLIFGW